MELGFLTDEKEGTGTGKSSFRTVLETVSNFETNTEHLVQRMCSVDKAQVCSVYHFVVGDAFRSRPLEHSFLCGYSPVGVLPKKTNGFLKTFEFLLKTSRRVLGRFSSGTAA